ncbi:MAG: hypothetical protein KKI15_07565, partial [Proteobacteria bacterium]|nr:hypothetical protein [Pseudomonadota bacterium]
MNTLTLNLSNSASSRDTLWIEQEQAGQADGYLSRAGMYRSIQALLNQEMPDEPECVNECVVTLYVYRFDLALAYRLDVSHGHLGARITEDDLYFTEKIKVSMDDEVKLKYPCFGVVESRWLGDVVYDQDGMQSVAPSFVAGVEKISFAAPVYGTFAVTYRIHRDKYLLSLPKRETAIENKYSSVAFALFTGGLELLEVDPPAGVEQTDMVCTGGGGSTSIAGPADGRNIP